MIFKYFIFLKSNHNFQINVLKDSTYTYIYIRIYILKPWYLGYSFVTDININIQS